MRRRLAICLMVALASQGLCWAHHQRPSQTYQGLPIFLGALDADDPTQYPLQLAETLTSLLLAPKGIAAEAIGQYSSAKLIARIDAGELAEQRRAMRELINVGARGVALADLGFQRCTCESCQAAFRQWLWREYDASQLKEWGIGDLSRVRIPNRADLELADMSCCQTQLERLYLAWLIEQNAASYSELRYYAHTIMSDFIVASVTVGPPSPAARLGGMAELDMWMHGIPAEELAPQGCNTVGYLRGYARGLPYPVAMMSSIQFGPLDATTIKCSIAEARACQGLWAYTYGPDVEMDIEIVRTYRTFVRGYWDLFSGTIPAARIALLDSDRSALVDSRYEAAISALGTELAWSGYPYVFLWGDRDLAELRKFNVVFAALDTALSERQARWLRKHVKRGGKLVVIGDIATLDEWGQPLGRSRLADLLAVVRPSGKHSYESGRYGAGVVYRFDTLPERSQLAELLEATGVGRYEPCLVKPPGSRILCTAWGRVSPLAATVAVHLVNYEWGPEADESLPQQGLRLELPRYAGWKLKKVTWLSPDGNQHRRLTAQENARTYEVDLPVLQTYSVVAADYQPNTLN